MSEELEKAAIALLEDATREAVRHFHNAIAAKGLVLTEELKNSMEMEVLGRVDEMKVATMIHFASYGRYKDMRVLSYKNMMPVEAIEKFVERLGVGKFGWIPGYEKAGKMPIGTPAVRRIAAGISFGMHKHPTVNQGKRHAWYNKTKADFINVTRRTLMERAAKIGLEGIKKLMEEE